LQIANLQLQSEPLPHETSLLGFFWSSSVQFAICILQFAFCNFALEIKQPRGVHVTFDPAQRAVLAGLADVLIPAADGMPSASAAAVAEEGLNQVLAAVPSLEAGLADVLAKAKGREPAEVIANLARTDPSAYGVLTEVVTAAYFMNPDVRKAVGYTGQGPSPLDPRVDYMENGLLESVIKRGPIFRSTPKVG
jgi:hypothetical protein